jgi:hypothetical protein
VLPRARKDHLTVRELPDETLVYNRQRHRAHCLNPVAALVWRHCDGRTPVDELAHIVSAELGIADAAAVVALALEQLGRRHLLEEAPPPLPPAARVSRREALKQLAAAAATLPIILTIATRAAAQTLSEAMGSDPPATSPVQITVPVTVPITISGGKTKTPAPAPAPCRTRGQSCLAGASGQQGTCCSGLRCNGVSQGAGVCA